MINELEIMTIEGVNGAYNKPPAGEILDDANVLGGNAKGRLELGYFPIRDSVSTPNNF